MMTTRLGGIQAMLLVVLLALLVWVDVGWSATQYSYQTIDFPCAKCSQTMVTGINPQGDMTGAFADPQGAIWGFTRTAAGKFTRVFIAATSSSPQGINQWGQVIGPTSMGCGLILGFLYHNGEWEAHEIEDSIHVEPMDVDWTGASVGAFRPIGDTYWCYARSADGQTIIPFRLRDDASVIAWPSTEGTSCSAVDLTPQNDMAGHFEAADGHQQGWVRCGGVVSVVNIPGAANTFLEHVSPGCVTYGTYIDAATFRGVGFRREPNGALSLINVPGSASTFVKGSNGKHVIGGYAVAQPDGSWAWHGFKATPISSASVASAE